MTVDNCRFSNNQSEHASSLTNQGENAHTATMFVRNSTFTGNLAGYVIYNYFNGGTVNIEIENCFLSGNPNPILNKGNLLIKSTTFSDNVSDTGVIFAASGSMEIINSTFSNNRTTFAGRGGAITFVSGNTIIKNSTFANNTSPDGFGIIGVVNVPATLEISNSIFKSADGGANINPNGLNVTSNG